MSYEYHHHRIPAPKAAHHDYTKRVINKASKYRSKKIPVEVYT